MKGATAQIDSLVTARVVSIHAPVKGATMIRIPSDEIILVSIHAPVKGATSNIVRELVDMGVSIHAPVKGATRRSDRRPCSEKTFQSTHTREGCDLF